MSWQAVKAALRHQVTSATYKAVLVAVAEHAHEDGTGSCPSIKLLASESCADPKTVRRCIAEMVEAGVLHDDDSQGRRGWAVEMGETVTMRRTRVATESGTRPTESGTRPEGTRPDQSGTRPKVAGGVPIPSKPPMNHQEPPALTLVSEHTESSEDEFERWYKFCPKKVGKGAARRAWPAARRKASLAVLCDGMEKYRDDPTRKPQFTLNPASWLNQERWLDETQPLTPAVSYDTGPVIYR